MATGTWGRSGGSFSSLLMGGRGFALLLSAAGLLALFAGELAAAEIEWVPGEILVQMTEDAPMRVHGRHDVELPPHVLAKARVHGLKRTEAVFPEHARGHGAGAAGKGEGPGRSEEARLGRWMRLELHASTSIPELAKELAALEDVEVAEPNYIYRAIGVPAEGWDKASASSSSITPVLPQAVIPNDPDFSTQWGLDWIDAPEAWGITMGSPAQVIAIIDTGVDLDHEDLSSKIWTNPYEAIGDKNGDGCPGVCGVDDDGDGLIDEGSIADDDENGYVDDLRGWDWVNADADPNDDNGHGTHCAGIAAAATNNGIGIAGACPSCRIMPLKVMSSNGTGSVSDQAKAIEYAWRNGATVISMSFGSSADSSILKNALALAYPHATLVAAAGNERKSRKDAFCAASGAELEVEPFFPADYNFVIGVEAVQQDGSLAEFSNCGYKTKNPGKQIRSSWGNGSYHTLNGTSMAAPMLAGTAGLLRALKAGDPTWDAGLIHTQLVATEGNAYQSLNLGPQPQLAFVSYEIRDLVGTCATCDGDGAIDAGETVEIVVTIENQWANAVDVTGAISLATADPNVTMVNTTSTWGDVGPNAQDDNDDTGNRFSITVSESAANGHTVYLLLTVSASNGGTGFSIPIQTPVRNAVEKSGIILSDEIWESDRLYLITGNLRIESGVTVTIQPGTTVLIDRVDRLDVKGTLDAVGTPGQRITFAGNGGTWLGMKFSSGVVVDASGAYISGNRLEYCIIRDIDNTNAAIAGQVFIKDSMFLDNPRFNWIDGVVFEGNLFNRNSGTYGVQPSSQATANTMVGNYSARSVLELGPSIGFRRNSIFENGGDWNVTYTGSTSFDASQNYWGTQDSKQVNIMTLDFYEASSLGVFAFEPLLLAPSSEAPAVVASVSLLPGSPVGAERLTFVVQFSRSMKCGPTDPYPELHFGTAVPYTQKRATLNPQWIDYPTCTQWSVETNITKFTGDGNYKLQVIGAEDFEGFPLPTGDYRFGFEVITSGTSSAALSAVGGAGKVDLTWNASTSETLAGYNIYRASTSGGTYTKLNGPLIADTFYSDITADPGITYFYVYREINTSLEEGPNSDEAAAAALDDVPPLVTHMPVSSAPAGIPITVSATITDNAATPTGAIFHRALGSSGSYTRVDMINASGSTYTANVPASSAVAPGVEYYIEGFDGVTQVYHGSAASPHPINIVDRPVISGVSPSSGGATGGTSVTITGGNFKIGATVSFGGSAATNVVVIDASTITCTTPAHYPDRVDISITNPNNETGTLTNAYIFEGSQTIVRLPTTSADRLTSTTIDITTPGATDAISATFELTFDPAVITFQSASLGTLTSGWSLSTNGSSSGTVRLALAGSTPVTGLGSFVSISFSVVGDPAASSALTWVEATLNDGALPATPENGTFTVNNSFDVSGSVTYYNGGAAVASANVTLDGPSSYSDITDASGTFSIPGAPSANYSLAPVKNDGISVDTISALDASLVLQADAGLATLTADQLTAGDVNGSGAVTAHDASRILEYAAGLTGLPFQGNGKVWSFTPSSRNYAPLESDQTGQNFTGVVIGDVTGNWSPPAALEWTPVRAMSSGSATVSIDEIGACYSGVLPVRVSSLDTSLYGIELTITYDPSNLTVHSLSAGSLAAGWAIAANNQAGSLTVAMASSAPIQTNGVLFELNVSTTSAAATSFGFSRISLNEGAVVATADGGSVTACISGDMDGNGSVSSLDIFYLINHLKADGPAPAGDADVNNDGFVDEADLTYLTEYLYASGADPQ